MQFIIEGTNKIRREKLMNKLEIRLILFESAMVIIKVVGIKAANWH